MSSIDALTLRSRVETALSDELGSYTYTSGDTIPALTIEGGQRNDFEQPKVTGLEVIIEPYTAPDLQVYLGREIALDDQYRILLRQWDIAKTVATAVSTLVLALNDCLTGIEPLLPRNTRLDSIEQQALLIQYRRI